MLKTLVTEDMIIVEGKGVDAEPSPNFVHLLMASNDHWVVPAGADERRYYILDVGENKKQDAGYFRQLYRQMDEGGREALLHYLMTLDLADFEVRQVPQTSALQEQKLLSLTGEEQWWMERLMDGRTTRGAPGWQESVQKEHVQSDYLRYAEDQRLFRRVSPTVLGRFLVRHLPEGWPKSVQRVTDVEKDDGRGGSKWERERVYWYDIPALDVCRKFWDKKFGGRTDWPTVEEDELPNRSPELDDPY